MLFLDVYNKNVYIGTELVGYVNHNGAIFVNGKRILTLKSNYLNTLEPGIHKLELEYSDGIVNTEIIITKIENVVSNTKKANDNLIIIIASIADALLLAFIIFMCRKNRKKSSMMEWELSII